MYANFPGPKEYSTSNNIKSPSPDISAALYGGGGGGGGGGEGRFDIGRRITGEREQLTKTKAI